MTRVVDEYGDLVPDYFLEFLSPGADTDETVYFHRKVLVDVHNNGANPAYRCLYADRNELVLGYYGKLEPENRVLEMSISANPPGDNVSYFDDVTVGAKGTMVVHQFDPTQPGGRWLQRNRTHFVQIVIPRNPKTQVFNLAIYAQPQ